MWKLFHQLASPPHFYRIAAILIPWFMVPALLLIAYGTYAGLFLAPMDYQQGDAFRIIYVHVPSAYLSMMTYMVMAISAGIGRPRPHSGLPNQAIVSSIAPSLLVPAIQNTGTR